MTQGSYIPESTQDLIRRAERILEGVPVLDLTNWDMHTYIPGNMQIRTLAPSCHSITVKNTITITDTSIVICSAGGAPTLANCPVPASCPASPISPTQYVNLYAIVTALVAQTGVQITFKYVLDDVPTTQTVTVDLVAGTNNVWAFATNAQYPVDTALVLYGADVTKY